MSFPPAFPIKDFSFIDFSSFCNKANLTLHKVELQCLEVAEREREPGKINDPSEVRAHATRIAEQGLQNLKAALEKDFDPLQERDNIEIYVNGNRETFLFKSKFLGDIIKVLNGKMDAPKDDPSMSDESGYASS